MRARITQRVNSPVRANILNIATHGANIELLGSAVSRILFAYWTFANGELCALVQTNTESAPILRAFEFDEPVQSERSRRIASSARQFASPAHQRAEPQLISLNSNDPQRACDGMMMMMEMVVIRDHAATIAIIIVVVVVKYWNYLIVGMCRAHNLIQHTCCSCVPKQRMTSIGLARGVQR